MIFQLVFRRFSQFLGPLGALGPDKIVFSIVFYGFLESWELENIDISLGNVRNHRNQIGLCIYVRAFQENTNSHRFRIGFFAGDFFSHRFRIVGV